MSKDKIIKNIGWYTLLNFFNSAIPFLLLPILTKNLSIEQFAIIDLFNNVSYILLPLVGLNIGSSIIRFYYDKDQIDLSKFIYNILFFLIVSGLFLLTACLVFSILNINLLGDKEIPTIILLLAVAYALFSQICEVLLSLWRAEELPINYGIFRICKTVIDLGISIYLILFISQSWQSRIYSTVLVSLVFSIWAVYIMTKKYNLKRGINRLYLKIALKYSAPLILHGVGGYVISFSDRFVILHFMDLKSVGLYGVAYQVGMIMSFIGNSFSQAWTPFVFAKLKLNEMSIFRKLDIFNYFYFVMMILLSFALYFMVPIIYRIFIGKQFDVSPTIVFWVLLGYGVNGMYKIVVNYMFYYKKTGLLAIITCLAALVNVFMCWILVPVYGLLGAAVATTIAFFVMFILVYIQYLKIYKTFRKNNM